MPDDFVELVSQRYIELYERITGLTFEKGSLDDMVQRIKTNVDQYLMSK